MSEKLQTITLIGRRNATVRALIDTGADYNFMKKSVATKLGLSPLKPTYYYRAGVERKKGLYSTCTIKIGRRQVPTAFIIVPDKNIDRKVILGHYLLQQRGVSLDFRREKIILSSMHKVRRARL